MHNYSRIKFVENSNFKSTNVFIRTKIAIAVQAAKNYPKIHLNTFQLFFNLVLVFLCHVIKNLEKKTNINFCHSTRLGSVIGIKNEPIPGNHKLRTLFALRVEN